MLICGMVFHQQNDNPTHQKQSMNGESSVETYDPGNNSLCVIGVD